MTPSIEHYIKVVDSPTIPAGSILISASPLPGCLPCDGRAVSKAQYNNLFSAIGSLYGSSGTNFNLPDFRGRPISKYEPWWDSWPCQLCKDVFTKHEQTTWWCLSYEGAGYHNTYRPMDKLDYFQMRYESKNR